METTTEKLNPKKKKEIEKILHLLDFGFHWDKTSSGRKYWGTVYDKFRELSKQETKCIHCGK